MLKDSFQDRVRIVIDLSMLERIAPANDTKPDAVKTGTCPVRPEVDFEEISQVIPVKTNRRKRRKKDVPNVLERMRYGGSDGNGELLPLTRNALLHYVRFVLGCEDRFSEFVEARIKLILREPWKIRKQRGHIIPETATDKQRALRAMVIHDLRKEVNGALLLHDATFQLEVDTRHGRVIYRTCQVSDEGAQKPYFVAINAFAFRIDAIWLPGAFTRYRKCKAGRRAEYRSSRKHKRPMIRCVRRF